MDAGFVLFFGGEEGFRRGINSEFRMMNDECLTLGIVLLLFYLSTKYIASNFKKDYSTNGLFSLRYNWQGFKPFSK